MDDISQKREALMKLYGPSWRLKVQAMSDSQVVAIFIKFRGQGKV